MERYFMNQGTQTIHITEWGHKQNPVIFCLHGLGSTSLSFIEIADRLKDEYRLISVDAPGHGKTDPFEQSKEYEMPNMATWVDGIIEQLEVEEFYFLSHSWGSFVSLFYIASYPEKVKGTILIDGGYQGKRHSDQTVEEEIAFYEKDFEEYVHSWEAFLDVVKSDTSNWSPLLEIAAKDLYTVKNQKYYWHARGKTAAHFIKAMHKHEAEDIYEQLPPDILLLRATLPQSWEDKRKMTSRIFEKKASGKVKSIPNATHLVHWDLPDVVADEIRSHWSVG
ncbi:alpha/beta fold hydrolase [Pontibacillus marinus]|uniref:Lipase n=1 Tax=Pontibacillus marinus BH030004 = DSM 16465 TaxID=1385511 RepID=A0A0A5GI64_9BACI|nr:alpha/beta hydrolase [Pontibacillus marinus]KGX90815.1 lipase [Pontibacillus marinus BH030004 = DSM 16465]